MGSVLAGPRVHPLERITAAATAEPLGQHQPVLDHQLVTGHRITLGAEDLVADEPGFGAAASAVDPDGQDPVTDRYSTVFGLAAIGKFDDGGEQVERYLDGHVTYCTWRRDRTATLVGCEVLEG